MEQQERNRLVEIMERMAEGDQAAAITLFREFGDRIGAMVARIARSQGATHLEPEDVDAMALDVCLDLVPRAGSWDPDGGALPWVWAERRIVAMVGRTIGQYGRPLDERLDVEDPGGGPAVDLDDGEALVRLAAVSEACALVVEALATALSERDRAVLLQFEVQRTSGDPSPAHTVADAFGMTPAAVRQVVKRGKDRLARLAAGDDRFAGIAGLPLLHRARAA